MLNEPLTQVLILLAASILVVTIARRLGLPTILGYLIVGMGLGPHAIGVVSESPTTDRLLSLVSSSCCSHWDWSFPFRACLPCAARCLALAPHR